MQRLIVGERECGLRQLRERPGEQAREQHGKAAADDNGNDRRRHDRRVAGDDGKDQSGHGDRCGGHHHQGDHHERKMGREFHLHPFRVRHLFDNSRGGSR